MRIELFNANALNFVELNYTGDNENYIKCSQESKFADGDVFNLFAHCFESSNELYEYFGATKFNARKIVPLRNELLKNLEVLEKINSVEDFIDYTGNILLGQNFVINLEKQDGNWKKNYNLYKQKLITFNTDLFNLVEKCIEKGYILWVIGY